MYHNFVECYSVSFPAFVWVKYTGVPPPDCCATCKNKQNKTENYMNMAVFFGCSAL